MARDNTPPADEPVALERGTPEWFAAWDAADEADLVEQMTGWVGDPETAPTAEQLAAIAEHERENGNREPIVLALEALQATDAEELDDDADDLVDDEPVDEPTPAAEFYDLIGKDGRRIHRNQPKVFCEAEKARINAATGERLRVVKASAFVLGPEAPAAE